MTDVVFCVAAVIGVIFMFVASLGVLRLPDFYARLHAPTKAATLGLASLLLAFVAVARGESVLAKAMLCLLFVGVTVPIGAHILARAAYRSGILAAPPARPDEYAAFARASDRRARGADRGAEGHELRSPRFPVMRFRGRAHYHARSSRRRARLALIRGWAAAPFRERTDAGGPGRE